MWMHKITTDRVFQFLFFFLCVFYIIFYMPYGFEDTDTGYIFGSSWNIYNGQIPHRDFIYTRPAIPAFFHTLFLFVSETYAYILDRGFFYIQIFLYSFLGAKLLCEKFIITSKSTLYFLAILGAVFSIHNYPPMAWNTVDGVFFSMIGIYLLLQNKVTVLPLFIGSLCITLGMLSKQSFYFMPLFIFIYFLVLKEWKRLLFFSVFGVVSALLYFAFKYSNDSLTPFLEQTFQRTSTSALIDAGVKAYYLALKFNIIYLMVMVMAVWIASKFIRKVYTYALINLIIAVLITVFYIQNSGSWSAVPYIFQLMLVIAFLYSVYKLKEDKNYLLLMLLLALSWSASISNGYRTPIHFSLPLVFALYVMFFNPVEKQITTRIASLVLGLYLVAFYIGYQTIYRDSNRKELTYAMGDIFPQLHFIKSDKATYNKYAELKQLAIAHPNFTVIPSVTHAHYLTKTINPIGTDWPLDVEINNEAEQLVQQLAEKNAYVFLEKKKFSQEEIEGYTILGIIKENWVLTETGHYFDVYISK